LPPVTTAVLPAIENSPLISIRRIYETHWGVRVVAVLLVCVAAMAACARETDSGVGVPIRVVFNHDGEVVEPPTASVAPRWTHKQALAAVTHEFPDGTTQVWFGSYQGKPAWLAITESTAIAIPGTHTAGRGYTFGVYADGETPLHLLGGQIVARGKPPVVNAAPARRTYDGRLHVTFVTAGPGAIGATPSRWMVEPAPAGVHPIQARAVAGERAHTAVVNLVDANTRVYFGLFTGIDNAGASHAKTPAWLVVGSHLRLLSEGPGSLPDYGYGVTAFSDDLTQPWVSDRLQLVQRPFAY
ncbi:MAG TPA: hypothetical protein VHD87_04255, partial [Acidimicrobiales bacterium]|nr:hypothetical protein [Acidimicrobiales bacterium]